MHLSLIVSPVDFTASGEAAVRRALALARWHEADLHVLYVRAGRARRNAAGAADPLLGQLVKFISSLNPEGVAVTPVVLTGDPATAVAEYAAVKSADLVVVGQNGRRGSRFWSSSTLATDVARSVTSPTLIVSNAVVPGTNITAFNNILCAIDFSAASLRALSKAMTMAQQSSGRITLLHVLEGLPREMVYSGARAFRLVEDYRARVEKVKGELRSLVPRDALNWCEVDTDVVSGIGRDAINAAAWARHADLVVLGAPVRTRCARMVMASTLSGVLRRARCPVLAVPEPSEVIERARKTITADRDDEPMARFPWGATHEGAPGNAARHR